MLVMGAGYGVLVGFLSRKALNLASKRYVNLCYWLKRLANDINRRWVDKESFFSYPVAMGVSILEKQCSIC